MAECVGCGYCCRKAPCHLGYAAGTKSYSDRDSACEFLAQIDSGQYRCGLYLRASPEERPGIAESLAFGAGCCASLFNFDRELMCKRLRARS